MEISRPWFLLVLLISIPLAQLLLARDISYTEAVASTEIKSKKTRKELIDEIQRKAQSVQGKILVFEQNNLDKKKSPKLPSKKFTNTNQNISQDADLFRSVSDTTPSKIKPEPHWNDNSSGIYFLPFWGLTYATKLDWTPTSIPISIESANGFLSGFRLGYDWKHIYLEQKSYYFLNKIEKATPDLLGETEGDISGFSTFLSAGLNFPLSEYVEWNVAGGIGGTSQQLDIQFTNVDMSDSGLVIAYQFSTGIEFRPVEHFLLGIHYNWYYTQEFSAFSSRHLNSFELSLGYFD
jgi:opacity protein-like surface antigen